MNRRSDDGDGEIGGFDQRGTAEHAAEPVVGQSAGGAEPAVRPKWAAT